MDLNRGEVWHIHFPYTFDINFPNGKDKFVVVLQEGAIFKDYDAVTVLLVTSDPESKGYDTNIVIEEGTTKLNSESYIICAQPYTILKNIFHNKGAWMAGTLSCEKLNEVDEALYIGLCMGMQNNSEQIDDILELQETGTDI